ncbi:MAG: AAA family ATPase [Nocardioidaceae bacterium]
MTETGGNEQHDQQQTPVEKRYLELRSKLLDVAGLRNIPAPIPLVDNYLYRDSLAWLGGKPGHAKSFIGVDIACSIGAGHDWHGHKVSQGKVLYLIAEGASGLSLRVDAWSVANGTHVEGVLFLPTPVQMLDDIDGPAFATLLADLRPSMVVLDTQARVTVGAEENSSKDMGQLVDTLERLREASRACILVVHHEARNGENLRGSTALEGAATTILRSVKDGDAVTITTAKQKDAPEQGDLTLALRQVASSAYLSHEGFIGSMMTESENWILTVLRQSFGTRGAGKTELREACDLPKSSWYRAINSVVTKGLVLQEKEGQRIVYRLAADDTQEAFG